MGIQFLVIIDGQAIVHLNTQKTVYPQVVKLATLLSEFNFEIKHRQGVKMSHIDALSRAPTNVSGGTEIEVLDDRLEVFITISEEEQVISMQQSDAMLRKMVNILSKEESERSTIDKDKVKNHTLQNGILYKEVLVDSD